MDIITGMMIAVGVFIFIMIFVINDPHGAAIVFVLPAILVFLVLAAAQAILYRNQDPAPPTTVEQKVQRIDVLKSIPQRNINGTN